jgi:hypothetical protein
MLRKRLDLGQLAGLGAVLLLIALVAVALGACKISVPVKLTAAVMYSTQTMGKGFAVTGWQEHRACLVKHGAKTQGYATCVKGLRSRLKKWQQFGRASSRSSVAASYGAIRIAQEKKKGADVLPLLKIGGCALTRMAKEFKDSLPDKGAAVMAGLAALGPLVCTTPKAMRSSSLAMTIIPLAVDLVKWIVGLIGAPTEQLLKEIDAWVRGPAADETDPLLAEIVASLPD